MQREDQKDPLPSADKEIEREGEKNRKEIKEMDEVPAHGTDPLHEGP